MDNQVKIYYIPTNPNIKSGAIYTLYINNNTNLDLTSIITEAPNSEPLQLPNLTKITLDRKEYNQLLSINNKIQEIMNARNNKIEAFFNEEKQIITEVSKLNTEYSNILNNLSIKGGINE